MLSKLFHQFRCSTMMLPEHVEALDGHERDKKKTAESYVPEVDQQQLEEWEWLLKQSASNNSPVRITYLLSDGKNTATGIVERIDSARRVIVLRAENELKTICANMITAVEPGAL